MGGFRYTEEQDVKKRSGPEVSVGDVVMLRLQWAHTQHFLLVFAHRQFSGRRWGPSVWCP